MEDSDRKARLHSNCAMDFYLEKSNEFNDDGQTTNALLMNVCSCIVQCQTRIEEVVQELQELRKEQRENNGRV